MTKTNVSRRSNGADELGFVRGVYSHEDNLPFPRSEDLDDIDERNVGDFLAGFRRGASMRIAAAPNPKGGRWKDAPLKGGDSYASSQASDDRRCRAVGSGDHP